MFYIVLNTPLKLENRSRLFLRKCSINLYNLSVKYLVDLVLQNFRTVYKHIFWIFVLKNMKEKIPHYYSDIFLALPRFSWRHYLPPFSRKTFTILYVLEGIKLTATLFTKKLFAVFNCCSVTDKVKFILSPGFKVNLTYIRHSEDYEDVLWTSVCPAAGG